MSTLPQANVQGYGIGTYQPIQGYHTVGQGWPSSTFTLDVPGAGLYGGLYGFKVDTRIRAPTQVAWTPAPLLGLDGSGVATVRGFATMLWQYTRLRPDYWYYLLHLYKQSGKTPPEFQYIVLVQYLDQAGSGTLLQQLARMDPPTHSYRDVAQFVGVTLTFHSIGKMQVADATQVVIQS